MSFLGGSSGGFGSQQASGGVFGGQSTQQQSTNLFGGGGGTVSVFGGGSQQPRFTFPSGTGATSQGGGGGGMFGSQSSNIFGGGGGNQLSVSSGGGGGLFGTAQKQTTAIGLFQAQPTQSAGTSVTFDPVKATDTMPVPGAKNGATCSTTTKFQTITVMKQYENKSLEELRLEDYQLQRHRKPENGLGLFGSSTPPPPPPQPTTGSLFSSTAGSPFAKSNPPTTAATSSSPFGGTGLFGQQSSFGQSGGSGVSFFGSPQQQKPGGGLFGTTSAFGGAPTTTTSGGSTFAFPASTSAPQQNTGSAFCQTGSAFGTKPGGSLFTSTSSQPQGFGFGGQQPTTASTSTNVFGSGGAFGTSATTASKPLFGTTAFGTTPTSTTTATTPAFGTTGGLFGTTAQQSKPLAFGATATPSTSTAQPVFGGATTTTATASPFATAFSAPTATQQPKPSFFPANSAFASSGPTSTAFRPAFGSGGSGFNLSSGSMMGGQGFQGTSGFSLHPGAVVQPTPSFGSLGMASGPFVTFATTPFKDNELFYGLPDSNKVTLCRRGKKFEKLAPPRDHIPMPGRPLKNYGGPFSSTPINLSNTPVVRRLTFYTKGTDNNLTKYKSKIFDGFEEEDLGIGIDVLSPKTDVKKLDLSCLKNSLFDISEPSTSTSKLSASPSKTMAGKSMELERQREMKRNSTEALGGGLLGTPVFSGDHPPALSPLARKRRVRFTLPSSSFGNGGVPSPIYFPGGMEEDTVIGRKSPPISLEESGVSGGGIGSPIVATGGIPFGRGSGGGQEVGAVEPGAICRVVNTREGYYLRPSLEELDKQVDSEGRCLVTGLEIGRRNFGKIKFICPVDIAGVDIDKLVQFRHKEVVVYPDDLNKPQLGHGLNVPAEIHLERVWPVEKESNELIRCLSSPEMKGYEQKLRKACVRMGADFLKYDWDEGLWTFRVAHF